MDIGKKAERGSCALYKEKANDSLWDYKNFKTCSTFSDHMFHFNHPETVRLSQPSLTPICVDFPFQFHINQT